MEARRGRKLGAFYGKQPYYSTWENVSDKEKIQVLTLFFKNDVKKENESVLNESVH